MKAGVSVALGLRVHYLTAGGPVYMMKTCHCIDLTIFESQDSHVTLA